MSWNKERGQAPLAEEEERIDDDLDFEEAKFTITLHKSCSRPVTEKGSPAATSCFYLRDE